MYLDALSFLEDERDAFRPYEALDALSDEQLLRPVEGARGWSGRDLMVHLLVWLENLLVGAKELAVRETSPTLERADAEWDGHGDEDVRATWADVPVDEVRSRFRSIPGELRGYLTVVPESRWIKHPTHLRSFVTESLEHYDEHRGDLAAILDAARG